jgi:hypothetical protein
MKKIISILVIVIFVLSGLGAVAQVTNNQNIKLNNHSIKYDIKVPDLSYSTKTIKENQFSSIQFESQESTNVIGEAKIPVINYMFEIPIGEEPILKISNDYWIETSLLKLNLDHLIEPVQPSVIKNRDRNDFKFTISQQYYSKNKFYNTDKAKILETGIIRGHRYVLVQILPVQYNPVTGRLNILNNCDIEIIIPNADIKETKEKIDRYRMAEFDTLLERSIINYGEFNTQNLHTTTVSNSYLIITDDGFAGALSSFKTWKEAIGFDITITKTSQIPGGPTTDNIQAYIQDAYDNWNPAPGYVLLVGDTGQIPAFTGQASYTATDLYYSTTDGTDYMPDILIGRFPGSQLSHITAMVDKTVAYESGDWASEDFLKKGAFMAGNDNYQITEGTHNYVISNYFDPKDWTCDKLYEVTYGATTQDVRTALSDGRAAAIYSGHGSTYSWADGPPFSQADVSGLGNNKKLSFVCSHACVTGNYQASECFGETWIRTPNKAAIVFWGSSANTLWDEDDVLEKRTLSYYFGYNPVAQMTNNGKIGLHGHYGGGGYTKYYFECYNIFGDPSIVIGFSTSGGGGNGGGGNYIPPRVGITRPSYGETVNGTVEIQGYAYGIDGPIKYVYIKIGDEDWTKCEGKDEWSYTWDSNSVEDGEILFQAVSIDSHGHQSGVDYLRVNVQNTIPDPPKIPDLTCEGELSWELVSPGDIMTGSFVVSNIGDAESLLDWKITDYPEDWGRWTFNPSEGYDLTPEDGTITIQVSVESPTDQEQIFSGQIKIVNMEEPDDFETIDVILTTNRDRQKSITPFTQLLNLIMEKFPFFSFLFR